MGAIHSRERNPVPFRVTYRTISTIEQCILTGDHGQLCQELSGFTREQRRELFRTGNLPWRIHDVISQKNEQILQFLVKDCKISLEVRDDWGLTPLYSTLYKGWETGAWILLRGGADVHNADRGPHALGCSFLPILHLAVQTGSTKLVQELVKKGVDINVMDYGGNCCISALDADPPETLAKFVYEKMYKSQSKAGESRSDVNNAEDMNNVIAAVNVYQDVSMAERFIKTRHSCEQRKMWQILGALLAMDGRYELALSYWKKTSIPCWLHDLAVMEETAPKSAFADILDEDVQQPLNTVRLSEETKLSMRIRALLAIERHSADMVFLTLAVMAVVRSFLDEDKIDSAVSLLDRLTETKALETRAIFLIVADLKAMMTEGRLTTNVPCNVLLKFLMTALRCLWFLTGTGCFGMDEQSIALHNAPALQSTQCKLCRAVRYLSEVYLEAMDIFCKLQVPATPQQNLDFHWYTKAFVSYLPWFSARNLFHLLNSAGVLHLLDPTTIKTLVVCSAEVKGQLRQENSPPHLTADARGDTPLHLFAECLSQEDLLDNGVLECFLKHGADLCTRNRLRRSVRHILVERGILSAGALLPSLQCAAAAAFMRDPQLRRKVDQCGVAALKHFLLDHY